MGQKLKSKIREKANEVRAARATKIKPNQTMKNLAMVETGIILNPKNTVPSENGGTCVRPPAPALPPQSIWQQVRQAVGNGRMIKHDLRYTNKNQSSFFERVPDGGPSRTIRLGQGYGTMGAEEEGSLGKWAVDGRRFALRLSSVWLRTAFPGPSLTTKRRTLFPC